MIPYNRHTHTAVLFFVIAVSLGLLMRLYPISNLEFIFNYVKHAHSHVALMGWVHLALITLLTYYFLNNNLPNRKYRIIFSLSAASVLGMLFSFPFQGYALFSIVFSSMFLLMSYVYYRYFFHYFPNKIKRKQPSFIVTKYALIYMVVSSIGPWAIGVVMATIGPDPFWYPTTIYFYLHFQYNAWIILGIIGVFLKIIENHTIQLDKKHFSAFMLYFNLSAILTFFISLLFAKPPHEFYTLSIIGSLLQFIALILFYTLLKKKFKIIKGSFNKVEWNLLIWGFVLFTFKITMQLVGSFPYFSDLIAQYHYLAIGFIHWIFLGVISLSLLALLSKTSLIKIKQYDVFIYLVGFSITELLIFYQPLPSILNFPIIPFYNELLFIASVLLVGSIVLLFVRQIFTIKKA